MKILKEFGKVAGLLGATTLLMAGYMGLKLTIENAKGCEQVNANALNPLAEFVMLPENVNGLMKGQKCSWGFKPK